MTISSESRKSSLFTGNDVATTFPFTFKVFADSDIVATRALVSTGAETVLVLGTDYTVNLNADQDVNPGGDVVLTAPLATGYSFIIASDVAELQPVDLTNGGAFYATVLNTVFDRLTILVQQLNERVSRSLRLAITTPSGVRAELPAPVAYKVIGWNADGTRLENTDPSGSSTLASDLAASGGAAQVGADDGSSGSIFTTVQGFITYLLSSAGAAIVGFIQAGTGAVMRSLQAKARDTVSVKDFGAIGDGVADDTAAFQAAIDSIPSGGAGSFFIPQGTYRVTLQITIDDRAITFAGSGRNSTIIEYVPAVAGGVLFNFTHYPQDGHSLTVCDLSIRTPTAAAGTAIKVEGKLTAAAVIVSGQRDSAFLERVRIIQSGTGYWLTFFHAKNNGGAHWKTTSFDNSTTDAQADPAVTGVLLEKTDDRVSMIRTLVADDFYILRTNVAISTKATGTTQVESLYLSNGEIVGCRAAGLKYEGRLGAIGLTHVHFDCNDRVIDGSGGEMLIATFAGCDFRKGETTGLANVAGPMIALDAGETIAFSGCVFSGFNHNNSNALNRAFTFSNVITGLAVNRMSVTGNTFRNLYSVFGPSANAKLTTIGNVYNVIKGVVMEDENTSTTISLRDAFLSKTINIALTASAEQSVSIAVPAQYWGQRWPVAILQQAGNAGTDDLFIRYDLDTSTTTACVFVIRGNNTARTVRFSLLAMGTVENSVA